MIFIVIMPINSTLPLSFIVMIFNVPCFYCYHADYSSLFLCTEKSQSSNGKACKCLNYGYLKDVENSRGLVWVFSRFSSSLLVSITKDFYALSLVLLNWSLLYSYQFVTFCLFFAPLVMRFPFSV